jgi:hypothetical protein
VIVPQAVYILCALTSLGCAALLTRSYLKTRARLLLWSSLCFALIAANNTLLFVDLIAVPSIDLAIIRSLAGCAGIALLVFGMIWESK